MKLLMKLQAGISFKNPDPYSPRTINHKLHHHNFSGPMIPEEARRRRNVNKFDDTSAAKDEPTSPKISCMGQIKQKKNKIKIVKKTKPKATPPPLPTKKNPFSREHPGSGFWTSRIVDDSGRPGSLFGSDDEEKGKRRWPQDDDVSGGGDGESRLQGDDDGGEPPRLGQLKKFASGRGRDTLSKFDWKKNTTEDGGEEEEGEDEDEVIISYSAPIMMTGGGGAKAKPAVVRSEQKNEINLWKRRTMAQPHPLHLKSIH